MKNVIDKLKERTSPTPSRWREEAEYRQANKLWLRHSQHIALVILDRMEQMGMTQKQLSEKMDCSQQYISKILKGRENLSLETISKIEAALGICILAQETVAVQ